MPAVAAITYPPVGSNIYVATADATADDKRKAYTTLAGDASDVPILLDIITTNFTAAASRPDGGQLRLSPGTVSVQAPFSGLPNGTQIVGSGKGATVGLVQADTRVFEIIGTNQTSGLAKNIILGDITLKRDTGIGGYAAWVKDAVFLANAKNVDLKRLVVTDFPNASAIWQDDYYSDGTWFDVLVERCGTNGAGIGAKAAVDLRGTKSASRDLHDLRINGLTIRAGRDADLWISGIGATSFAQRISLRDITIDRSGADLGGLPVLLDYLSQFKVENLSVIAGDFAPTFSTLDRYVYVNQCDSGKLDRISVNQLSVSGSTPRRKADIEFNNTTQTSFSDFTSSNTGAAAANAPTTACIVYSGTCAVNEGALGFGMSPTAGTVNPATAVLSSGSSGTTVPVPSGGGDAILASSYGIVAGASVHNNGPKVQMFINAALTSGKRAVFDTPGLIKLESSNGVPYNVVVDGGSAAYAKVTIEWAPGAVLYAPNAFGKAATYFTGATRATKVVTRTVPSGHGLVAGDSIEVYGPSDDFDDGDFTITSVTATSITYSQNTATGTNYTSGAAGSFAGWIVPYISCFKVVNFYSGNTIKLVDPQFKGPGSGGSDPNPATPFGPELGCGPVFASRVESHGLVSSNFYVNMLIDGQSGSNTDHFHHYDIKDTSSGWEGVLLRNMLFSGTRDFRFDTAGIGNCQLAGMGISISAALMDAKLHDVHYNASPYAIKKHGFIGVTLPSGTSALAFDDTEFGGTSKAEGSGNGAWDLGEATLEKVGGSFRFHGIECNGVSGHTATNHTKRDIALTAMTRAGTVVSATYSKATGAGTTTVTGSCVLTGLTSGKVTWQDKGHQITHANLAANTYIMHIISPTSIVVSKAATGNGAAAGYTKPPLEVGNGITIYTDPDDGATLNRPAMVKTVAGAGPYTMTAETVNDSGVIASIAASAGIIFGIRGGVFQHTVKDLSLSTQSDPSTEDIAAESLWDLADMDTCRFVQSRHPNAHDGYPVFPSINLRNGSATSSLRTVFYHGNDEAILTKALGTIEAGECLEIGAAGNRKKSTVDIAHPRGGEALQPAATTTSHANGDLMTRRPYFWATRQGDWRSSSGWPGIKVRVSAPYGSIASGELLVEDPGGTDGTAVGWSSVSATPGTYRVIGIATSADAGNVCSYETIPGESWRTV